MSAWKWHDEPTTEIFSVVGSFCFIDPCREALNRWATAQKINGGKNHERT
nr:MAG TPA: hypothetical protein [Caudoviricetes sp.]DAQ96414.1 MAG TPA: hypothetical protein [Caudoviricetes sp.]